jgi:hypothetical protein
MVEIMFSLNSREKMTNQMAVSSFFVSPRNVSQVFVNGSPIVGLFSWVYENRARGFLTLNNWRI